MSREALAAAEDLFDGKAPDGGDWYGGSIQIGLSFASPDAKVRQKQNSDGSTTFEATVTYGTGMYREGVVARSFLFNRFLKVFPGEESALTKVFMARVARQVSKFKRNVAKVFGSDDRVLRVLVGWNELEEWNEPISVSWRNFKLGRKAEVSNQKVSVPWSVEVKAIMTRKTPVNATPFKDMSDRELDRYIDAFASEVPENYYMDGEYGGSARSLRQHWRKMFRGWSPRKQVEQKAYYDRRYRMASRWLHQKQTERVATRWLEAYGDGWGRSHGTPIFDNFKKGFGQGLQDTLGREDFRLYWTSGSSRGDEVYDNYQVSSDTDQVDLVVSHEKYKKVKWKLGKQKGGYITIKDGMTRRDAEERGKKVGAQLGRKLLKLLMANQPAEGDKGLSDAEITHRLKSLRWGGLVGGGRFYSLKQDQYGWWGEPRHRERLDHFVGSNYFPGEDDDPEGWDSEGWEREYAGPLRRAVTKAISKTFGRKVLEVGEIGEKGHVHINRVR